MGRVLRHLATGYLVAVAAPALVAGVVLRLHAPTAGGAGYSYLFLGSVVVVALFWGMGPALVAAVLSA